MPDLRDPQLLGEAILSLRERLPKGVLSEMLGEDVHLRVPDYNSELGPIEKYGRPQDLPPTPF